MKTKTESYEWPQYSGNFFFGILLEVTPCIGYLFDLSLDISVSTFLYYLVCALMIGSVNLIVSFALALKVSLLSRDTSFGNLFSFLKVLTLEILKHPHHLILAFGYKKEETETKSNQT